MNQYESDGPHQTQFDSDHHLHSVLFAIPFPRPTNHHSTTERSPPFLLYTFPRSVYEKPPIDPNTGKRGKEKLIKKAERVWQQEVEVGEQIKRGERKDATRWQKFKGGAARLASGVIKYMPDNTIETLGRLPPKKKLGTVTILYPNAKDVAPTTNVANLNEDEMKEALTKILQITKKKAFTKSIISGCLLPVTAAIDFFLIIPIFAFEINIAYFSMQTNGAKKVKALTSADEKATKRTSRITTQTTEQNESNSIFTFKQSSPQTFSYTIDYLYYQCSRLDHSKFPTISTMPIPSYSPDKKIVEGMILEFQKNLPNHITKRHLLNLDRAAEDLSRTLKKAAKEYVKTLS
ncbi:hypothetical protein CROQUDRAFT_670083 [Cronartium quercuum f. sp. fusiforme G11]|uniref:Uncharacterized protein n=1 Tax=Cronartium quercuum f. sp. fusiforme G11 TaxID=708437 RepID=A0A9P6NJC6_9BASI|nr:hypothetical protein CROQUDRAFT_670083 [Cronartium quercuum f. sp. fusiforme G11]